jgi:hypothetical protein
MTILVLGSGVIGTSIAYYRRPGGVARWSSC